MASRTGRIIPMSSPTATPGTAAMAKAAVSRKTVVSVSPPRSSPTKWRIRNAPTAVGGGKYRGETMASREATSQTASRKTGTAMPTSALAQVLGPRQEPRAQEREPVRERGAQEGDDEEGRVHVLHLQHLPGKPEQRAEAAAGRNDLHGHGHDQRVAQPQPQAGEDERQGRGQEHGCEEAPAPGAVVHRGLDDQPVDLADAMRGRDGDQKERRDRDGGDTRGLAARQDEARQRKEQDARDGID